MYGRVKERLSVHYTIQAISNIQPTNCVVPQHIAPTAYRKHVTCAILMHCVQKIREAGQSRRTGRHTAYQHEEGKWNGVVYAVAV